MARVTVEDCLENVENRFELVLISSKRARDITQGAPAKVELDKKGMPEKPTVLSLREIGEGLIGARNMADYEKLLEQKQQMAENLKFENFE